MQVVSLMRAGALLLVPISVLATVCGDEDVAALDDVDGGPAAFAKVKTIQNGPIAYVGLSNAIMRSRRFSRTAAAISR